MRTTAQHYSKTKPLLLLYRVPSFGLLFFLCVQRAVQEQFDRRAWAYAMLYVNLYGLQLLYSERNFGHVFLTRTVPPSNRQN